MIDQKQIKNIVQEHLEDYAWKNQYRKSYIPMHTHNGTDSPRLDISAIFPAKKTVTYAYEINNGNSGSAISIDWTAANNQKLTLTANSTITFISPGFPCRLTLKAINFGAHTPTFSPAIKWPAGTAPSWTSSGTDIVSLYFDGVSYFGHAFLNFS